MFSEQPITRGNLNRVPDEPIPSMFLTDDKGRRYPARREIAARLLGKVHSLYLMRQEANFYSLQAIHVFNRLQQRRQARQEQAKQRIAVERGRAKAIPSVPVPRVTQPRSSLPSPSPPPEPDLTPLSARAAPKRKAAPKLTKRRARQPLPNHYEEALAQRVYKTINDRTTDPGQRISQASARRAVFTYGTEAVESVLKRLWGRYDLIKPVGFFMTILRSEGKKPQA